MENRLWKKIASLQPDMVTLDIEMPELDGVQTLAEIQKSYPNTKVIMVSSLTKKGATITVDCLENGALDFITKPSEGNPEENQLYFRQQLEPMVQYFTQSQVQVATEVKSVVKEHTHEPPQVLAIGSSTGGPKALEQLLQKLPGDFPLPVVIVQHMPKLFTSSLASTLNSRSALTVKEAEDGEKLQVGCVYVAPGGLQTKVVQLEEGIRFEVKDDPPEKFCKPAVDYLFRSIAKVYQAKAIGVILTGMGSDGTKGLKLMKRYGVYTFGQNKESSTVYGMPREAWAAGVIDKQLNPAQIAEEVLTVIKEHA
jgi:two-component system chemotaxis response regulator CheB